MSRLRSLAPKGQRQSLAPKDQRRKMKDERRKERERKGRHEGTRRCLLRHAPTRLPSTCGSLSVRTSRTVSPILLMLKHIFRQHSSGMRPAFGRLNTNVGNGNYNGRYQVCDAFATRTRAPTPTRGSSDGPRIPKRTEGGPGHHHEPTTRSLGFNGMVSIDGPNA